MVIVKVVSRDVGCVRDRFVGRCSVGLESRNEEYVKKSLRCEK